MSQTVCSSFIVFWLWGEHLFITQLVFSTFQLFLLIFFTTFHLQLILLYPSIVGFIQCVCRHPINFMGVHFLHCVHDNEDTETHDTICETFVVIV